MARSSREHGCSIEQFTWMKSPYFAGGDEPIVVENWVQDNEETLAVLPCIDEQKVVFAAFKLTGEAKCWWRSVRLIEDQRLVLVPVIWDQFKELFFELYFPSIVRRAKAVKSMHLVQGQMTVSQYAAQFIELSHFAPHLAPNQEKKARKAQTFTEVVNRATIIESGIRSGLVAQSQRKRPVPQGYQAGSSRGPWKGGRDRGD
ncbi:uncharacterized protein LOC131167589 [Malania oleifera]|uniref:uncharacterized protein LOC131167589 n=1 Tax=Malania oleifera TaxID=397392 RepID=UPI0025AE8979|nr:uncharacterized protein LOC131167589 [Malania oleifera]